MEFDCGFEKENKWFRYRAAGIIVEDRYVLYAGNENEDYYYSVGGAVKMGETAEEAVKREVLEETGIDYEVDYLAVIHENLFHESFGTLKGKECHEICMYFMMKPKGNRNLKNSSFTHGVIETMHWILIDELDRYKAYPDFLKDYLKTKHEGIVHIITDERKKNYQE